MSIGTRIISAVVWTMFLSALVYVGYVNELLKDAIAPWHRGTILIGFILGAGAAARYLAKLADRRLPRSKQDRR